MEMNKNVKGAILVVVFAIIAYLVYRFLFKGAGLSSKLAKGYAKKDGDWVGCNVQDYDKDYYSGINSAGTTIYFKKSDVKTRKNHTTDQDTCADAVKSMNVYTMAQ